MGEKYPNFWQLKIAANLAQWIARRTSKPATRVRIRLGAINFFNFFRLIGYTQHY